MQIIRTVKDIAAFSKETRGQGGSIGFVPTMGYLHKGHLSLVKRAKEENETVVVSIFVNPLQFGPNEDYDRYPRDEERDLALLRDAGVDAVFLPSVQEMYPHGKPLATVTVSGITEPLCGASRPGHFDGAATVVLKLFHLVSPDKAYFGMKDAQQVAVIERMVLDLNVPVSIVRCPTLREEDGLAMSSRNVYLTEAERRQAPALYHALETAGRLLAERPGLNAGELAKELRDFLEASAPAGTIDYAEVLSYPDLAPISGALQKAKPFIVALAVKFSKARLIDNRLFAE